MAVKGFFENIVNGATVTFANTPGGVPNTSGLDSGLIDGGSTWTGTTVAGEYTYGSRGTKVVTGPGGHAYGWKLGCNTPRAAVQRFVKLPAAIAGDFRIQRFETSTAVSVATLEVNAANKLRIKGAGGAVVWTFTSTMTLNAFIWVDMWVDVTTQEYHIAIHNVSTGALVEERTATAAAGTFGTTNIDKIQIGDIGAWASYTYYFGGWAYEIGATGILARQDVNTAPTITSITANQTKGTNQATTATVVAADAEGDAISYTWTLDYYSTAVAPTLTGASSATVGFTTAGTAGELYVLRCTLNGGATATTEVRVPTSGDSTPLPGYPPAGAAATVIVGGSASSGEALADSNDATYVQFPTATGSPALKRHRYRPMTPRSDLTLTSRKSQDVAGAMTNKARIFDGSTQRGSDLTLTSSTTIADEADTGSVSGWTDWGAPWVEYETAI